MEKKNEKLKKIKKKIVSLHFRKVFDMEKIKNRILGSSLRNNGIQKTANIAECLPFALISKQGKANSLFEYLVFSIFKNLYIIIIYIGLFSKVLPTKMLNK